MDKQSFIALLLPLAAFLLSSCTGMQTRPDFQQKSTEKVPVVSSAYFYRISDRRPEAEKITRTEIVGKTEIQLLGDDAFERSPLHDLARSTSTWLDRNPGKNIEVHSLIIHYGDEIESKIAMEYRPAPFYVSYDPLVIIISNLMHSAWQQSVGGLSVVVKLYVTIDGQSYFMEHIQSPAPNNTPVELVSAAIDFTGYKLSQELMK